MQHKLIFARNGAIIKLLRYYETPMFSLYFFQHVKLLFKEAITCITETSWILFCKMHHTQQQLSLRTYWRYIYESRLLCWTSNNLIRRDYDDCMLYHWVLRRYSSRLSYRHHFLGTWYRRTQVWLANWKMDFHPR